MRGTGNLLLSGKKGKRVRSISGLFSGGFFALFLFLTDKLYVLADVAYDYPDPAARPVAIRLFILAAGLLYIAVIFGAVALITGLRGRKKRMAQMPGNAYGQGMAQMPGNTYGQGAPQMPGGAYGQGMPQMPGNAYGQGYPVPVPKKEVSVMSVIAAVIAGVFFISSIVAGGIGLHFYSRKLWTSHGPHGGRYFPPEEFDELSIKEALDEYARELAVLSGDDQETVSFALVWLDGDNIPELVVIEEHSGMRGFVLYSSHGSARTFRMAHFEDEAERDVSVYFLPYSTYYYRAYENNTSLDIERFTWDRENQFARFASGAAYHMEEDLQSAGNVIFYLDEREVSEEEFYAALDDQEIWRYVSVDECPQTETSGLIREEIRPLLQEYYERIFAQREDGTYDGTLEGRQADDDPASAGSAITINRHATDYVLTGPDGKDVTVMESSYDTISVTGAAQKLQGVLDDQFLSRGDMIRTGMIDEAQLMYDALLDDRGFFPWYDSYTLTVERADARLLSILETQDAYYGGVHGSIIFEGYTYDVAAGEMLTLGDVVTDPDAFVDAIETQLSREEDFEDIVEYHREYTEGSYGNYLKKYYTSDHGELMVPWTLTEDGLHVWFSDYMLGVYMFGARDILLSYEEYPELFADASLFETDETAGDTGLSVSRGKDEKTTDNLGDVCMEEAGFFPADFRELKGAYISDAGEVLLITEWGDYKDYAATVPGEGEPAGGFLRANPGGYNMYENATYEDPRSVEERYYGYISLIEPGRMEVKTPNGRAVYSYSEEQTNLLLGDG